MLRRDQGELQARAARGGARAHRGRAGRRAGDEPASCLSGLGKAATPNGASCCLLLLIGWTLWSNSSPPPSLPTPVHQDARVVLPDINGIEAVIRRENVRWAGALACCCLDLT